MTTPPNTTPPVPPQPHGSKPAGAAADPAPTGAPVPKAAPARGADAKTGVTGTRTAGTWVALVAGVVILVVLLIFILQNNVAADITILGWSFALPLGVALLFAAVAGAVITVLVGGARILQLRRAYSRDHKPAER